MSKANLDAFLEDCRLVQMMIQRFNDPSVLQVVVAPQIKVVWKKYKTKVPYDLVSRELQQLHVNILNRNYGKGQIQKHTSIGRKPGQVKANQLNN